MDQNERQMIDDLFAKLKLAEQHAGPRDRDAEQAIAQALQGQPAAPYYMAQVILVQDHAMQALNQRIQDLERELEERPAAGSGFLGSLFGGSAGQSVTAARPADRTPVMEPGTSYGTQAAPQGRGWSNPAPAGRSLFGQGQPGGGGGFLGSALTTAAGVAGGVMLASALGGLFGSHAASAAEPAAAPPSDPDQPDAPDGTPDGNLDDILPDDGGDFDTFGDF